ncbi:helix-turn-helix domain-containing protein [Pedobacter caeni]|uniref:AraC-type DNA-binding protein n=1 Tax=Pedobacter caeni TaxID=288992 RepID=A0A1M4UNZ8_9SPHI|nr:AraC family transcriptional regulator [Pedobacter caeni]SHE58310.1 AraC-type DNA-binding protein [Pedobacter caeni]
MKNLQKGIFYGQTNETIELDGLTLTDTVYTHPKVDWHYHENAYFTFILEGNVIEGNKKETYTCSPGSLLFHNWQEPHYNIKPEGFTRGFHLEIEKHWFDHIALPDHNLQGSINIRNPDIKLLMYKIFRATKIEGADAGFSIQTLLTETLSKLAADSNILPDKKPKWIKVIEEILHDQTGQTFTLDDLSKRAGIHPVHLSRDFSKHFHCTLSEYARKLKVEKALSLISLKKQSLTEIAYECGFTDQSHFTRCFREVNGLNPSAHLKLLSIK